MLCFPIVDNLGMVSPVENAARRAYNAAMTTTPPTTKPTPRSTDTASGAYAYQARTLQQPTPQQIRAARLLMGQTQAAASALVYRHDSARWREWERELDHAGRVIDLAVWELYLIKSGLRVNT
jgi:hypothetical protein